MPVGYVTFWYHSCLSIKATLKFTKMNELILKYEAKKKRAQLFMKNGQISAYIDALFELNHQKHLLRLAIAN